MLSKILKRDSLSETVEKFSPPDTQKLRVLVEERKLFAEREKLLKDSGTDPVAAARKEAHRILQEAQEKLKEAEVEAALIMQKRDSEWEERKERELEREVQIRIMELKEKYFQSIEQLVKARDELFGESKKELLEMVFTVARKVLQTEIAANPQHIMKMIETGFARLKGARNFQIFLNPEDFKTVSARKEWLQEVGRESSEIKLVPDELVERGGCRIVTERGESSSELSKQLEIIKKEI